MADAAVRAPAEGRVERPDPEPDSSAERWTRRLAPVLERHASRHRFRWTLDEITRRVVPSGSPPSRSARRLLSLEGTFTAASRRGDWADLVACRAPSPLMVQFDNEDALFTMAGMKGAATATTRDDRYSGSVTVNTTVMRTGFRLARAAYTAAV